MSKAEVDMSNQINNSWVKNTALAVVQSSLRCSVLLNVSNKMRIKRFCEDIQFKGTKKQIKKKQKIYLTRAVSMVHAYLLHKLIIENSSVLKEVIVCADTHSKHLHICLQNIAQNKRTYHLIQGIKIKFGLKKKNNNAQKYVKSVAKEEIPPTFNLSIKDTEEIIDLIRKFISQK